MNALTNEYELDAAIGQINRLLASHGGGIEIAEHASDGHLRIRFVGMCAGCPCKPLTVAATIIPGLEGVAGVTEVEAEGARVSTEVAERLVELGIAPRPVNWKKGH